MLFSFVNVAKSQQLFYQNNFRGGVSGDGVSYYFFDFMQADTIQLANTVPMGSVIRKAYLFSLREIYDLGKTPQKDAPITVKLNQNDIVIDSNSIVTPGFRNSNTSPFSFDYYWITANDVTDKVSFSNNTLITPCQGCLITSDTSRNYAYITFYLLIVYENASSSPTNVAVFLNNKTYSTNIMYSLTSLNPINSNNDVGFALWTDHVYSVPPSIDVTSTYTLTSGLGNFYLGKLNAFAGTSGGGSYIYRKTLPGSFSYENNTLNGLVDDTPDLVVDSTDALVNIKNMIPNNSSTLGINTAGNLFSNSGNLRVGFFFAYSTPCPARSFTDTLTTYTICEGQGVTLGTQSIGNAYTWYPKVNLNDSTVINPVASPTTTTNYFVLIDSAGCKHTEQTRVYVTPAPKADTITSTNNICGGQAGTVTVDASSNTHTPYTYSLNGGTYQSSNNFTGLTEGAFSVTIKDNIGCTWQTNSVNVTDVNPANANAFISTTTGQSPLLIVLNALASTGVNTYNWYFNGLLNSTSNFYNTTLTDTGLYNISLIAYNNQPQCSDTLTFTVIVLPEDTSGVFIPNVFSPNNDGLNDILEVKIQNAELESFEIYDRWGIAVMKSASLKIQDFQTVAWDGRTTSGVSCSEGTYFYILIMKDKKGNNKEYKGFVTLVR